MSVVVTKMAVVVIKSECPHLGPRRVNSGRRKEAGLKAFWVCCSLQISHARWIKHVSTG